MHLYVQQSMFSRLSPPPCLGELTVCAADGCLSIGASVRNLVTLDPIAISAGPGLEFLAGRAEAHVWLDELLDVLQEVSGDGPFSAAADDAESPQSLPS